MRRRELLPGRVGALAAHADEAIFPSQLRQRYPGQQLPAPKPRFRCLTGPTAASTASVTPSRSHSSPTAVSPAPGSRHTAAPIRACRHCSLLAAYPDHEIGAFPAEMIVIPRLEWHLSAFPGPCYRLTRGFGSEATVRSGSPSDLSVPVRRSAIRCHLRTALRRFSLDHVYVTIATRKIALNASPALTDVEDPCRQDLLSVTRESRFAIAP